MYQEPAVEEDDKGKALDAPKGGKRLHRQWCAPCLPYKVGKQSIKMGQQTLDKWSLADISDAKYGPRAERGETAKGKLKDQTKPQYWFRVGKKN